MKQIRMTMTLLVASVLTACAAPKTLYSWGPYEPQVYEFFKGESPDKQILALEKHLSEAQSKGEKLPPGFYAHLGMLYEKVGRGTEFLTMLDLEKKNYPESVTYLDSLTKSAKK